MTYEEFIDQVEALIPEFWVNVYGLDQLPAWDHWQECWEDGREPRSALEQYIAEVIHCSPVDGL